MDKNEKAFPLIDDEAQVAQQGMTLRDYFAAKAMQADISVDDGSFVGKDMKDIAKRAYLMADAMLKERTKDGGEV